MSCTSATVLISAYLFWENVFVNLADCFDSKKIIIIIVKWYNLLQIGCKIKAPIKHGNKIVNLASFG